jgi:hypothetical protein
MRPLVEPPPSSRCICGGELQLKLIEAAERSLGKQREIFVCTSCDREQTFLADQDPYPSPRPSNIASARDTRQARPASPLLRSNKPA